MSLWDKITSLFKTEQEQQPEIDDIEEEKQQTSDVGIVFRYACNEVGITDKLLDDWQVVEKFEEWYQGSAEYKEIIKAVPSFIEAMGDEIPRRIKRNFEI